jgi:hypothetical protein
MYKEVLDIARNASKCFGKLADATGIVSLDIETQIPAQKESAAAFWKALVSQKLRYMTDALAKILAQPNGARFYRADLHIHSFSASHDVRDANMTAKNIVEMAEREGLSLMPITDHNEISKMRP